MKSILITGAHGFMGRHLALYCHQQLQAEVFGLGHGTFSGSELSAWGMKSSLNGDVSFANLNRVASETCTPDVIFHLAGGNSVAPSLRIPQEDFRRTAFSTCELLDWVRTHAPGTLVVLASTAAVYGAGHSGPISELESPTPYSPYGYHKRMAEMLCESYSNNFGLKTRIVRFFSVYGPELRKQLLWDTCQRLAAGQRHLQMQGTGNENRDWLHVSDCVAFLVTVAQAHFSDNFANHTSVNSAINCGTGLATSVRQVIELVCQQWGEGVTSSFSGQRRAGDPTDLVAQTTQALALGWTPKVHWQQGIAQYVQWFRQHVA
ncbi:MAG: NAD(P)-dependent oxidoreductase [Pirellulaceae bacterium]|nr:NAD(P)-dependent oxidoreductase [Pirellulaceae bacterium]